MTALPLEQVVAESRFGGKAVQLGSALRAGLPVPRGFALDVEVTAQVASGAPFEASAQALLDALGGCVAVRSSAVGEDAASTSFAGQHATVLNVRTAAALVAAVMKVHASAHAESALAYRRKLGVEAAPRIAVVVQELIDADCAGVLFTRNPMTGADERVIEAAWGLGEAVVAGIVTPDRYRLTRDGVPLEQTLGEKDLAIRPGVNGGTEEVPVAPELVRRACLGPSALEQLNALATRSEAGRTGGQDLEWAFLGERLFLLQRRAVTR